MTTINDAFPSKYVTAEDLAGNDQDVQVNRVEFESLKNFQGEAETLPVLYFTGAQKGFVCRRVNAITIGDIHGPIIEDWVGKTITLGAQWIDAFGKQQLVLRVRPALRGGAKTGAHIPADVVHENRLGAPVPTAGPERDADGLDHNYGAGTDVAEDEIPW